MKPMPRRTLILAAAAILSLGVLGFVMGVTQVQKPGAPLQPLPIPLPQTPSLNLQAVPAAAALDAATANAAVDPRAAKVRARKPVNADNVTEDGPDDGPEAAPSPPAAAPAPANGVAHGPF